MQPTRADPPGLCPRQTSAHRRWSNTSALAAGIETEACSAGTPAITGRLQVKALTFTGRQVANHRSGLTANCRAALPPIIGAISSSGILASRSLAIASQALVVS